MSAATTSLAFESHPDVAFFIQATLRGGTTNTGEITISGTDSDGVLATQRLVWDGTLPVQQTPIRWSGVSGATTAGLVADGSSLLLEACGASGDPVYTLYRLARSWPCHIDHSSTRWHVGNGAPSAEQERTWIGLEHSSKWTPRPGDEIVDQYGQRYAIEGAPKFRWATGGESHWECDLMRRET